MAITQTYNLDLVPKGVPEIVHCSQYDKQSRIIEFNILKGGESYSIPAGSSITVRGTKKDYTGFEYTCSYSGSTVSVVLEEQMTIFAGDVACELRIMQGTTQILGTANFILRVEPAPLGDDTAISETDLPLLEEAIEAAATVADTVERVSSILPSNTGTDGQVLTKDGTGAIWADGGSSFTLGEGLVFLSNNALTNRFSQKSDIDLNVMFYNFQGYVVNATNIPSGVEANGELCVLANDAGTYASQFYCPQSENRIFNRLRIGTTWRAWKEITDATSIGYTNTTSGLTATNVQDAIDELSNFDNEFGISTVADNVSVPSGTGAGTTVGTVTIPKGTYLFVFTVMFVANATGFRAVTIGTGTTISLRSRYTQKVQACNGTNTYISLPIVYNLNTATTYNVNCMQNSGSALDTTVYVTKVKLQ